MFFAALKSFGDFLWRAADRIMLTIFAMLTFIVCAIIAALFPVGLFCIVWNYITSPLFHLPTINYAYVMFTGVSAMCFFGFIGAIFSPERTLESLFRR